MTLNLEELSLHLADATGVSSQLEPEVHHLYAERFRKVLAEKLDAKLEEMAKVEPTPRPWKLSADGQFINSADGLMIAVLYDGRRSHFTNTAIARANGELILRCVNSYDKLKEALRIIAIKDLTGFWRKDIDRLLETVESL